jgi:hypothetical protein
MSITEGLQNRTEIRAGIAIRVANTEVPPTTAVALIERELDRLMCKRERLLRLGTASERVEAEIDSLFEELEVAVRFQRAQSLDASWVALTDAPDDALVERGYR